MTSVEITREYEMKSEPFQDYRDWIDQVFSQQFVLSDLKGQLEGSIKNQDWSDSESEFDFEESDSFQQLFSEECQTEESNVLPPVVLVHESQQVNQPPTIDIDHRPPADPQLTKTVLDHESLEDSRPPTLSVDHEPHGDTQPPVALDHGSQEDHQSATIDLDHGPQEDHQSPTIDVDYGPREDTQSPTVVLVHGLKADPLTPTVDSTELQHTNSCNLSKGHKIIKESNSEVAQVYLESPERKVPIYDEDDNLKSCQDYIDYMYFRLFETNTCVTTLNTTLELEDWLDQRLEGKLENADLIKSPREENWELESYSVQEGEQQCYEEKLCFDFSSQLGDSHFNLHKDGQISEKQHGKLELGSDVGLSNGDQCQKPKQLKGEKGSEKWVRNYDGSTLNMGASSDQSIYCYVSSSTWEDVTNCHRCLSPILKASATQDNPNGQLAPWLEEPCQFNMAKRHLYVKTNEKGKALLKHAEWSNDRPRVTLEDLPCGGCPNCFEAYGKWFHGIHDRQHWPWDPGGV